MLPYEKYVVDVPPPQIRFLFRFLYCLSFQFCHKQNATRRCKFGTNRSPPFLLIWLFPKCKDIIFNTTSAKSTMVSVETYFPFRLSSRFLNVDRPSSSSMFGYNPTTSILNKVMSLDNFCRERSELF